MKSLENQLKCFKDDIFRHFFFKELKFFFFEKFWTIFFTIYKDGSLEISVLQNWVNQDEMHKQNSKGKE